MNPSIITYNHHIMRLYRAKQPDKASYYEKLSERKGNIFLLIFSWFVLICMLVYVDPTQLRDVLIPNIYLPFLLAWFFAQACTWMLLLHHQRRGVLLAVAITIGVMWKFVGMLNIYTLLFTVVALFFLEVSLTYITRK